MSAKTGENVVKTFYKVAAEAAGVHLSGLFCFVCCLLLPFAALFRLVSYVIFTIVFSFHLRIRARFLRQGLDSACR